MKKVLLVVFIMNLLFGICFAETLDGTTKALNAMTYVSRDPLTSTLDNGIITEIRNVFFQWRFGASYVPGYYSAKTGGLFSTKVPIEFKGIELGFLNTSDDMRIIKWSESSMAIGNINCLPFLDGVKWANAGNPSALPDTIVPPGQLVVKTAYLSRVYLSGGREWQVIGEPISKDNDQQVILYLKMYDSKGISKYYTIKSPTLGIRE